MLNLRRYWLQAHWPRVQSAGPFFLAASICRCEGGGSTVALRSSDLAVRSVAMGQFRTLSVGLDQDVREPARSPGTRITSWTN